MTKRDMIYAKFETLEEQLAHCYFLLHERFIANAPLARFWAETAMEELQHFSILRFCRERGLMKEINLDPGIAGNIEELLETVKVSVDEAFYAALLMESSELDEVYEKLTLVLAKEHPLLYAPIHASLRSHLVMFADGAGKFCGDLRIRHNLSVQRLADSRVARYVHVFQDCADLRTMEEIMRGDNFNASVLSIRWTKDF